MLKRRERRSIHKSGGSILNLGGTKCSYNTYHENLAGKAKERKCEHSINYKGKRNPSDTNTTHGRDGSASFSGSCLSAMPELQKIRRGIDVLPLKTHMKMTPGEIQKRQHLKCSIERQQPSAVLSQRPPLLRQHCRSHTSPGSSRRVASSFRRGWWRRR